MGSRRAEVGIRNENVVCLFSKEKKIGMWIGVVD